MPGQSCGMDACVYLQDAALHELIGSLNEPAPTLPEPQIDTLFVRYARDECLHMRMRHTQDKLNGTVNQAFWLCAPSPHLNGNNLAKIGQTANEPMNDGNQGAVNQMKEQLIAKIITFNDQNCCAS